MPITVEMMYGDVHPFSSLHKVERRIREFLAKNQDKGYTLSEIYDAVIPYDLNTPKREDCEPVAYILSAMYCNKQVNTMRLDAGIVSKNNVRYFRHRDGTEQVFKGPTPDDDYFPDREGHTERIVEHDAAFHLKRYPPRSARSSVKPE